MDAIHYKLQEDGRSINRAVYKAPTEEAVLSKLERAKEIWGKKYPYALSSWEQNWDVARPFFQFSDDILRIMYTTNIIEGVNRQFRKATKKRVPFQTTVPWKRCFI